MVTHLVPVATDLGDMQTIRPIAKGDVPEGSVIFIELAEEVEERVDEFVSVTDGLLGRDTTRHTLPDDPEATVYQLAQEALQDKGEVWLNTTALDGRHAHLPMTVASLQFEKPDARERATVYTAAGDGYERLPTTPDPSFPDSAEDTLRHLASLGSAESVTALASDIHGEEMTDSDRSRIQYHVQQLAEKGYVERIENGNRFETHVSPTGAWWLRTHGDQDRGSDETVEMEADDD